MHCQNFDTFEPFWLLYKLFYASTFASGGSFVASWRGDEIELGQLHVAGDVDPPACGPAVGDVVICVADWKYQMSGLVQNQMMITGD